MNPFARMYFRRLGLGGWLKLVGGVVTTIGVIGLVVLLIEALAPLAPIIFVSGLILLGIGTLLSPRDKARDEDLPYY